MLAEDLRLLDGLPVVLGDPLGGAVGGENDQRYLGKIGFGYGRGKVIYGAARGAKQQRGLPGLLRHAQGDKAGAAFVAEGAGLYAGVIDKSECERCAAGAGTEYCLG